jgi:hypothetical protein
MTIIIKKKPANIKIYQIEQPPQEPANIKIYYVEQPPKKVTNGVASLKQKALQNIRHDLKSARHGIETTIKYCQFFPVKDLPLDDFYSLVDAKIKLIDQLLSEVEKTVYVELPCTVPTD